jgi:hypothetical protein
LERVGEREEDRALFARTFGKFANRGVFEGKLPCGETLMVTRDSTVSETKRRRHSLPLL